jgi:hypothetical protein
MTGRRDLVSEGYALKVMLTEPHLCGGLAGKRLEVSLSPTCLREST